jgi:hypothetical protein
MVRGKYLVDRGVIQFVCNSILLVHSIVICDRLYIGVWDGVCFFFGMTGAAVSSWTLPRGKSQEKIPGHFESSKSFLLSSFSTGSDTIDALSGVGVLQDEERLFEVNSLLPDHQGVSILNQVGECCLGIE